MALITTGLVVSSKGDPAADVGKSRDVLPLMFKILMSHFQVIGQSQYLVGDGGGAPELIEFFRWQSRGGTFSTDISVIGCELGSTYEQYMSLQLLPLIFFMLTGIPVVIITVKQMRSRRKDEEDNMDLVYREEVERNQKELFDDDADLEYSCRQQECTVASQKAAVNASLSLQADDLSSTEHVSDSASPRFAPHSPLSDMLPQDQCEGEVTVAPMPLSSTKYSCRSLSSPQHISLSERTSKSRPLAASIITLNFEDSLAAELEARQQDRQHGQNESATCIENCLMQRIADRPLAAHVVESLALTIVVVLFLLYTMLLETSARMLQCQDIDFGREAGNMHSVLIADRTIRCDSPEYRSRRSTAIVFLIVWGLGTPFFSVFIMNVIRRLTLYGHTEAARTLFFYMTGGFKGRYYYWEAVTMARKALTIMIVVLIEDRDMRAYGSIWAMFFFLALHAHVLPYTDTTLSHLEAASLLTIVATLNLLLLQSKLSAEENPGSYWTAVSLVYIVNGLLLLTFLVTILRSLSGFIHDQVANKAFWAFLRPSLEESDMRSTRLRNEELRQEIDAMRRQIGWLHGRRNFLDEACRELRHFADSQPKIGQAILDYQRAVRRGAVLLRGFRGETELRNVYDVEKQLIAHWLAHQKPKKRDKETSSRK